MAEFIVFNLAESLVQALGSAIASVIVSSKRTRMETEIQAIKCVLLDAEKKQSSSNAVRVWVGKVRAVLYEADDVLDAITYQKLRNRRTWFLSSSPSIFYPSSIKGISKIEQDLQDIARKSSLLGLSETIVGKGNGNDNVTTKRRDQTYAFVPEEEVIGRDKDKKQVIEMLVDSSNPLAGGDNNNISVVPIVGSFALGKTTLAQFVFNDEKVGNYFELRMWVCVPDVFDYKEILMKITESATNVKPDFGLVVDQLQRQLLEVIQGKVFLLVLDDMRAGDANFWDPLVQLLARGAKGSKILVTTRSENVATSVGTIAPYKLDGLSDENSWSLFERVAFEPGEASKKPELVEIGKKIVRKCGNVPLIVRMVANLVYQKGLDTWLHFGDEKMDIMEIFSRNNKDDLLNVLKPSYDELSSFLKQCFAYCSLFPKGYEFSKPDLVHLWMSQGYLEPYGENLSLEDVGEEFFQKLLDRCFFQDTKRDAVDGVVTCRMHHMVRHLAQKEAGAVSVMASSDFTKIDDRILHVSVRFDGKFPAALFQARKIRTLLWLKESACGKRLNSSTCRMLISNFKCLRALDLHDSGIETLPSDIGFLIHLRYLDLSKNDSLVTLPESITELYNLQTLKLNFCQKLERLPISIGKLVCLRCLEIDECDSLTYMPLGLGKLTSLQTLNRFVVCTPGFDVKSSGGFMGLNIPGFDVTTSGGFRVLNIPGFDVTSSGGFRVLKTPGFDVKSSGGLRVFNTLNDLRGRLKIELSGQWTEIVQEAPQANLSCKTNLTDLKIEWRLGGLDDFHSCYYYGALLEGLQPPPSLRVLCIEGYRGKDFPSWARMDNLASFLPNLVSVSMEGCRECKYLPPFGQLKSLKCLTLRHMEGVQYVENGSPPSSTTTTSSYYPSLKELTLHGFYNLQGWWKEIGVMPQHSVFPSFLHLVKLKIWNCPKLTSMPLFPRAGEVDFQNVNEKLLEGSTSTVRAVATTSTSSSTSTIVLLSSLSFSSSSAPKMPRGQTQAQTQTPLSRVHTFKALSNGWLQNLPDLRRLHLKGCSNLKTFPKLGGFCSLQFLIIDKCDALTSLVEGLPHLTSLEELEVSRCKELDFWDDKHQGIVPWETLTRLRYLTFREIPKMESLPVGLQRINTLKFLWISTCNGLTALPEWLHQIPSLQHLRIECCPMLTSLPQNEQCLSNLVKLEIMECPKLMERCREPKGNDWPKICRIPRVLLHKSWRYGLMNDAETTPAIPEVDRQEADRSKGEQVIKLHGMAPTDTQPKEPTENIREPEEDNENYIKESSLQTPSKLKDEGTILKQAPALANNETEDSLPHSHKRTPSIVKMTEAHYQTEKVGHAYTNERLEDKQVTELITFYMEEAAQNKLAQIRKHWKPEDIVWEGSTKSSHVSLADLDRIIQGKELDNNVIDAYAEYLEAKRELEDVNSNFHRRFKIFDSPCWLYVTKSEHKDLAVEFTAKLMSSLSDTRYLIFPIISGGSLKSNPNHWTLLVLDIEKCVWTHYNSLKPKTEDRPDVFFEDAQHLRVYVEKAIKETDVKSPITKRVIFDDKEWTFPMESYKECPQQTQGSSECGVHICHIMNRICKDQPIEPILNDDELSKFKADMISTFIEGS